VSRVPFPALFLGGAGLIPFAYGVALLFTEPGDLLGFGLIEPSPAGGVKLLQDFGAIILGFMGGCLWGFASAQDRAPSLVFLTATIVPAFIAFIAIQPDPALSCVWLAFGFVILQGIDVVFQRAGVTPDYWLSLRLPLTAGVMTCLLVGALHG
jgi:hypothetical protein